MKKEIIYVVLTILHRNWNRPLGLPLLVHIHPLSWETSKSQQELSIKRERQPITKNIYQLAVIFRLLRPCLIEKYHISFSSNKVLGLIKYNRISTQILLREATKNIAKLILATTYIPWYAFNVPQAVKPTLWYIARCYCELEYFSLNKNKQIFKKQ